MRFNVLRREYLLVLLRQQQHKLLVILFISLCHNSALQLARGHHSIDTGELSQEIAGTQRNQQNTSEQQQTSSNFPNLRWLLAKSSSKLAHITTTPSSLEPVKSSSSQASSESDHRNEHRHQVLPTTNRATAVKVDATTSTTTTTISKPSDRSWIESILVDVESVNLSEQERREKFLLQQQVVEAKDDEDSTSSGGSSSSSSNPKDGEYVTSSTESEYVSAPSSAPTDSGEDPLESQIATTIVISGNGNGAQYEAATTLSAASSTTSAQFSIAVDDADEQKLLESNNAISAIPASSSSSSSSSSPVSVEPAHDNNNNNNNNNNDDDDDADDNSTAGSGANNPGAVVTLATRERLTCERAYTQCALRRVCAPALRSYNDDCQDLIMNKTSKCTSKCLKSMIALRSSDEGDDLANCDCEDNDYCQQSKLRSQACQPDVERAIDPKTIVSCSTATWICMADQLCSTALDYYYRNCQTLFSQRHCSMRCNNSLAILYRQPKASKLINCQCDGAEDFPCLKYKTLTERLCLNKHQHHQTITPTMFEDEDAGDDFAGQTNAAAQDEGEDSEGQATAKRTNEDESANLTNDPADMPIHGSGGFSKTGNSDEGDYGGPEVGGGENTPGGASSSYGGNPAATSNNNFFNGIQQQQQPEDNWIPLLSGRYFNDQILHQRRWQQQQQRQLQNANRQRSQNKQQSSSANGQHQQRRPAGHGQRNGTRHRNKSGGGGGGEVRSHKYARVFALTSSSASMVAPLLSTTQCFIQILVICTHTMLATLFIVRT